MIQNTRPRSPHRQRLLPLALLLASVNLYAQQPISISLTGTAEVPPVTTLASGSGQITILPDRTISGSIRTSGISASMAHVHEAAPGKNGPPIITLTKAVNDSFVVPPETRLSEAQYRSYTAGNLYINVHSSQYPDGEIRGQLPRPAN